jgi:hypothetical protein
MRGQDSIAALVLNGMGIVARLGKNQDLLCILWVILIDFAGFQYSIVIKKKIL